MIRYDPQQLLAMPDFSDWNREADTEREALLSSVQAGAAPAFKPKIWQDLKNNILRQWCAGKCMYCEGNTQAGAHDDAEHYRPKNAVHGTHHRGYYWLAYAWQNILLSCVKCNRPPGKGTQFPIAPGAIRVETPSEDINSWWDELSKEEPLLLHPYCDDPSAHFYAGKHGFLKTKTDRGRVTVEICKLNRLDLCAEREREESQILSRIAERLQENKSADEIINRPLFSESDRFSFYLNVIVSMRLQFGTP